MLIYVYFYEKEFDILFVGFNLMCGVIEEVMECLEQDGIKVNYVYICLIYFFLIDELFFYV